MAGYRHLSEELLEKLDQEIEDGIRRVERDPEGSASADVAVSFKIAPDKDTGRPMVSWSHKHADTEKGSFEPSRQARLAFAG